MKIQFLEDTEDIRANRSKVMKKGDVLICISDIGKKYIEMNAAKVVASASSPVILTVDEAKKFEQKHD